jgi:AraC-like DNA-binding protein
MRGSAAFSFTSADEFGAKLSDFDMEVLVLVLGPGRFRAQLNYIECGDIRLALCHETLPRIASMQLSSEKVCMMFPTREGEGAKLGQFGIGYGNIALFGAGYRGHIRTPGDFRWGVITFEPKRLPPAHRIMLGPAIREPDMAFIFTPARAGMRRLLRLSRHAIRVAETSSEMLRADCAARGLETALVDAATACLSGNDPYHPGAGHQRQNQLINRLDDVFLDNWSPGLRLLQVAAALAVPVDVLRECCQEQLGMCLESYMHLRQLNKVRRDLERADPMISSVKEIAARRGFRKTVEFAAEYLELFGEPPATTLRRTALSDVL